MIACSLTGRGTRPSVTLMRSIRSSRFVLLLATLVAVPAVAQTSVRFSELAGWWSANPAHAGESSHVALQFLEKDGKQEARLWLMAIGAYDIPLGEVTISGNSIDTKESFPLTWNPTAQTLSGHLPADAAPVYNIPIEFKRSAPVEKPAPRDWTKYPQPKLLWSVDTGASVWAGLERDAATGLLFVANENGDLHAIDRDGKLRWKFPTGKPIRAQPKVIGKSVYLASDSGYLYKLHRDSGTEQWRARVDTVTEPRLPGNHEKTRWDRFGSSVVADKQRLYIASRDKNLYALDIKSGREAWRVAADDIMTATPALHGDLVYFADYSGKVRAVSARNGAPRWTYDAKLAVPGDLIIAEGLVLIGSRSYDLIALDVTTGKEHWRAYRWFSWIESPPVVRGGRLYTGSSDATNVYAINVSDGSLHWKTPVPGYSWQRIAMTPNLLITGTLGKGAYPASRNGSLFALDRETGAIRWMYLDPPTEETVKAGKNWGFAASPVVGEGVVYAADFNGRVYAFELM
jgi:outer membrane protein assembly factor BamB